MKVYSCSSCDPPNGSCLLTVQQDDEAPANCPYDDNGPALWVLRVAE